SRKLSTSWPASTPTSRAASARPAASARAGSSRSAGGSSRARGCPRIPTRSSTWPAAAWGRRSAPSTTGPSDRTSRTWRSSARSSTTTSVTAPATCAGGAASAHADDRQGGERCSSPLDPPQRKGVPLVPTLTIDGKAIEVPAGTNLIEAARLVGVEVPHYCYHPGLPVAGACRLCMVDLDKAPRPTIACNTQATEGMVVLTQTPRVL